ncbi:MAG TPA: MATE family efflux transporter, partial [Lachnospiraceae bacterium]
MTTLKENKMGTMPIPKLLFSMALPMILSMLVQALYNLVDSIFVAQINENALSAVSLVFPIQNLMIALSSGTCVGINSLLSRRLGEKDYDNAYKVAHNGLLLAGLTYLIFATISLTFADVFLRIQTDNQEIITYAKQYMTVICAMSFGLFFTMTLERLLQSTGLTHLSMISQISGALFNLIFDPILIFGLLGFPKMGVMGAALATVSGQILGIFIALCLNIRYNKEIKFSRHFLRFDKEIVSQIYIVAV